ncbi:hypothetical protein D3C81_1604560 [compost metagenome]
MDKHQPLRPAGIHGFSEGIVEGVPGQNNLHRGTAEHTHLVHLLAGSGAGHVDFAADAEGVAGIGHTLGMVACAGADDSLLALFLGEATDLVVSAADFEGADHLKILPLQENLAAVFLRQIRVPQERSSADDLLQRMMRQDDFAHSHSLSLGLA